MTRPCNSGFFFGKRRKWPNSGKFAAMATPELPKLFPEIRSMLAGKARQARTITVPASLIERRQLGVTDFATGGALAAARLQPVDPFPIRRPLSFIERLGVTMVSGLSGADGVGLPVQTGKSTVTWTNSESDTPAESTDPAYGTVLLSPHPVSGYLDVKRRLLLQTADAAEAWLREELRMSIMEAVERVLLQGTGAGEPMGINGAPITTATAFAATGTPTRAEIIDTIGEATSRHAGREDLTAVMAPAFATAMRKILNEVGSGRYLIMGGILAETVPYTETGHCPANTLFVGQWSDAVVGMWDEIDVTIDPYAQATAGAVRVVVHHTIGVGFRRQAAFVKGA